MININDFKHLDEFSAKLTTSFPRIKDICYMDFIEYLVEALQQDFQLAVSKRQMLDYVIIFNRRILEKDKPLTPYIPIGDAYYMINITRTLIANNMHYQSMDELFLDAIEYLENDKINHENGFKIRTKYMNSHIFPEKNRPGFVAVCTGRGGGKTYSQMEMLRKLCGNDVYLKCCRPIDLKNEVSEAVRKGIVDSILYGDGRNVSSEDNQFELIKKKHHYYGFDFKQIFTDDILGYCVADAECVKEALNSIYGKKEEEREEMIPKCPISLNHAIEKVIFNDPATIVYWANGDKTVVKCQNGEAFDPEKGLAMAISKRALGDCHEYYETFKKYTGKYYKQEMKKSAEKITDMVVNDAPHEKITEAIKESKEIIDKKPKRKKGEIIDKKPKKGKK